MSTKKPIIISIFITILSFSNCRFRDCDPIYNTTYYKFDSGDFNYFNYRYNSKQRYLLNQNKVTNTSVTDTIMGTYNKYDKSAGDCGGDTYYQDYKYVNLKDSSNKIFIICKFMLVNDNTYNLYFDFKDKSISRFFEFNIGSYDSVVSIIVDNKSYNDVFLKKLNQEYDIYYSKSKGLVKLLKNNIEIISLLD